MSQGRCVGWAPSFLMAWSVELVLILALALTYAGEQILELVLSCAAVRFWGSVYCVGPEHCGEQGRFVDVGLVWFSWVFGAFVVWPSECFGFFALGYCQSGARADSAG